MAGVFNVGGALSQTYGSHMAFGIFAALFICSGMAMGQAVVAETFFTHERGAKMVSERHIFWTYNFLSS
jgi:hypothetical protein